MDYRSELYVTGHRINAILKLGWEDISFERCSWAPFGTIRWWKEYGKIENEHEVAMSQVAYNALRAAYQERGVPVSGLVFPSESNADVPVERHLAPPWLRKAGLA